MTLTRQAASAVVGQNPPQQDTNHPDNHTGAISNDHDRGIIARRSNGPAWTRRQPARLATASMCLLGHSWLLSPPCNPKHSWLEYTEDRRGRQFICVNSASFAPGRPPEAHVSQFWCPDRGISS